MNRILEEFRKDDMRILDKLVDGELTDADRKELLSNLDEEPGAWRRCALAFLEAQSWRGDLAALRTALAEQKAALEAEKAQAGVVQAEPSPSPVTRAESAAKPSRFFELCLAMAACVVMAFGVGVWVHSMWNPPGAASRGVDFAQDDRARSPLLPPATAVGSNSPWHQAKLSFDDPTTQGPDEIELPVVESQNLTEDWLRQNRSALPEDVKQALERSGHRVIQRQQLVPIPLKDGRRLLVPVEQVDLEPASKRPAY